MLPTGIIPQAPANGNKQESQWARLYTKTPCFLVKPGGLSLAAPLPLAQGPASVQLPPGNSPAEGCRAPRPAPRFLGETGGL